MSLAVLMAFAIRLAVVALFLPFSAWDKIAAFPAAVTQACGLGVGRGLGVALILAGLGVEVLGSAAVLSGVADRLAALVLAGYCAATALLYKRFWAMEGRVYQSSGPSARREAFFDFWKNLALGAGFAVLALGATAEGIAHAVPMLLADLFASTHPYVIPERP